MNAPPGISATDPGITPVLKVTPAPGSRLEQLLVLRQPAKDAVDKAKADLDAAKEHLEFVKDGITAEVYKAVAGQVPVLEPSKSRIEIAGSQFWPTLRMLWLRPWRINSKRMQRENPVAYATFAERGKGYWDLRPAGESPGEP